MKFTAKRTDANHAEFRQLLNRCGVIYGDLSGVGRGWPDLLVLVRGVWQLIEIKDGKKPPSARELTGKQKELHLRVAHAGGKIWTFSTIAELENLIGAR
jgi:hypothetical protein